MEQEARHYIGELIALLKATRDLIAERDLQAALLAVIDFSTRLLAGQGGGIYFFDPEQQGLKLMAVKGHLDPDLDERLRRSDGMTRYLSQAHKQLIEDNHVSERRWPLLTDDARSTANLATPLFYDGKLLGIIVINRSDAMKPFDDADVDLLTLFGAQAVNVINNARLFEEMRRQRAVLEGVNKISTRRAEQLAVINAVGRVIAETLNLQRIYEQLAQAIHQLLPDISTVFISLYDATRQLITCTYAVHDDELLAPGEFPPIPLEAPGVGTQSQVVRTRLPIIANDLLAQLKQVQTKVEIGSSGPVVQSGMYVPMLAEGKVIGVMVVQSYTINRFSPADAELLGIAGNAAAVAIENTQLFEDLKRSNAELALAYDATIEGWSRALDLRDRETEGHTRRVTAMTVRLARVMGMSDEELVHIRRGALLHDIGKMGVPDTILLKAGPLTGDEWAIMQKHPEYAYEMLSPIAYLDLALSIPYCHHEKWDGTGYPRGLKEEQIPLAARIFAVADVWDALRSNRPYRKQLPREQVIEHIRQEAGTHFDPKVADAFLKMTMIS